MSQDDEVEVVLNRRAQVVLLSGLGEATVVKGGSVDQIAGRGMQQMIMLGKGLGQGIPPYIDALQNASKNIAGIVKSGNKQKNLTGEIDALLAKLSTVRNSVVSALEKTAQSKTDSLGEHHYNFAGRFSVVVDKTIKEDNALSPNKWHSVQLAELKSKSGNNITDYTIMCELDESKFDAVRKLLDQLAEEYAMGDRQLAGLHRDIDEATKHAIEVAKSPDSGLSKTEATAVSNFLKKIAMEMKTIMMMLANYGKSVIALREVALWMYEQALAQEGSRGEPDPDLTQGIESR